MEQILLLFNTLLTHYFYITKANINTITTLELPLDIQTWCVIHMIIIHELTYPAENCKF